MPGIAIPSLLCCIKRCAEPSIEKATWDVQSTLSVDIIALLMNYPFKLFRIEVCYQHLELLTVIRTEQGDCNQPHRGSLSQQKPAQKMSFGLPFRRTLPPLVSLAGRLTSSSTSSSSLSPSSASLLYAAYTHSVHSVSTHPTSHEHPRLPDNLPPCSVLQLSFPLGSVLHALSLLQQLRLQPFSLQVDSLGKQKAQQTGWMPWVPLSLMPFISSPAPFAAAAPVLFSSQTALSVHPAALLPPLPPVSFLLLPGGRSGLLPTAR